MYNEYNEMNPVLYSGKFKFSVKKRPHPNKSGEVIIEANAISMWQ